MKKGFAWLSRKRFEDDGGRGSWRISPSDGKLAYEQKLGSKTDEME